MGNQQIKYLDAAMRKFYPATNKYQEYIRQDVLCEARYRFLVKHQENLASMSKQEVEKNFYYALKNVESTDYYRKPYAYGFGKLRKEFQSSNPIPERTVETHSPFEGLTFTGRKVAVLKAKGHTVREIIGITKLPHVKGRLFINRVLKELQ